MSVRRSALKVTIPTIVVGLIVGAVTMAAPVAALVAGPFMLYYFTALVLGESETLREQAAADALEPVADLAADPTD